MSKELIIDVETTDLNPVLGNITELGYIYKENGKIVAQKEYKGLERNIYLSFVNDLNHFVDRYNPNDKLYFIGYNSKFDSDFIREMFRRNRDDFYGAYFYNPAIDVMQIAALYFKERNVRPSNFKLITLLEYFDIPFSENKLHTALYDVIKTDQLLNKLSRNKSKKVIMKTKSVKGTKSTKTSKNGKTTSKNTATMKNTAVKQNRRNTGSRVTIEPNIQYDPTLDKYRARVSVNGVTINSTFTTLPKARKFKREYMNMRNA